MPETLPQPPATKTPSAAAAAKSRWLDYARTEMSGMRKWLRRSASRENLVQGIKTFAWVGPLTVLIWIYAERAQFYRLQNLPVIYELRISDPNRVVTLQQVATQEIVDPRSVVDTGLPITSHRETSGTEGQISVELSGPKAAVERVREELGKGDRLKIDIDPGSLPGRSHTFDAARLLNNMPLFRDNGVAVTDVTPKQLFVYVDEIVEVELDVAPAPNMTNLVGNPTFDPPKVTVRGPRRDLESAGAKLQAFAELSPFAKKPGEQTQTSVAIRQPANSRLEIKPANVHATFVVRESDATGIIRQMPVWVSAAPGLADKYKWEIGENGQIYNVKVVGPPDVIAALEKEQIKPRAIVFLTREDIVNSMGSPKPFPVRLDLPENVRGAGDDPKRTVTITVTERAGSDG